MQINNPKPKSLSSKGRPSPPDPRPNAPTATREAVETSSCTQLTEVR